MCSHGLIQFTSRPYTVHTDVIQPQIFRFNETAKLAEYIAQMHVACHSMCPPLRAIVVMSFENLKFAGSRQLQVSFQATL